MSENTPRTLRQALDQALAAGSNPVPFEYIDYLRTPAVMLGEPQTGTALITNHYSEALTIGLGDYQGAMACGYPAGYDPRAPQDADVPQGLTVIYKTDYDADTDTAAHAVAGLRRMAETVCFHLSTPAERIAQRIATARELAQVLAPAVFEPLEEAHLVELARRVYARAAVWFAEDAALLADAADEQFNDEQDDNDHDPVEVEDTEDTNAPAWLAQEANQLVFGVGNVEAPSDPRALCVDVLASLMHAAQAAHGNPYAVYDAAEAFDGIHYDPRRP